MNCYESVTLFTKKITRYSIICFKPTATRITPEIGHTKDNIAESVKELSQDSK